MLHVFSEGCDTRSKCDECDVTVHGWKLIYRLPDMGRLLEYLFFPASVQSVEASTKM